MDIATTVAAETMTEQAQQAFAVVGYKEDQNDIERVGGIVRLLYGRISCTRAIGAGPPGSSPGGGLGRAAGAASKGEGS